MSVYRSTYCSHLVLFAALLAFACGVKSDDQLRNTPQLQPKLQLKPHPQAMANTHAVGEVDKPELVPFIVTDSSALPGIVVDETQATLVGKWQYSTHTPPYVGLGYLHDQKANKGKSSLTYRPNLPHTGIYEIRLSHCYNVRRSTNTPVTIKFAGGQKTLRINQQAVPPHGKLFRSLGKFKLKKGKASWVRISNEGTDGKYVIADAVQYIPIAQEAQLKPTSSESHSPAQRTEEIED